MLLGFIIIGNVFIYSSAHTQLISYRSRGPYVNKGHYDSNGSLHQQESILSHHGLHYPVLFRYGDIFLQNASRLLNIFQRWIEVAINRPRINKNGEEKCIGKRK